MSTSLLAPSIRFRYFNTNGDPLASGKVYTYTSGTSTPANTYSDATGTVLNTNPIILDSLGEADIYLTPVTAYRFIVKTSADVVLATVDGIYGTGSGNSANVGDLIGTAGFLNVDTDGTLAANSDTKVPSQKAVKTYVTANTSGALGTSGGTISGNLHVTGTITVDGASTQTGLITATAGLTAGGNRVQNVGTPSASADATTKAYVDAAIAAAAGGLTIVPAGSIVMYGSATPPTGWLECAGQLISRSTYSNLFAILGVTYGVGDGTTTFKIPDLRGIFPRGWDHGAGVDAGRTLGSLQAYATALPVSTAPQRVTAAGLTTLGAATNPSMLGFVRVTKVSEGTTCKYFDAGASGTEMDASNVCTGDAETRPANVSLVFIIKT